MKISHIGLNKINITMYFPCSNPAMNFLENKLKFSMIGLKCLRNFY